MTISDEITNLILTMIETHSDYGDDLNFTKVDIENLMKKCNFLKNIGCNELGWIILYKNKYITPEQFADHMDIECINDRFYLIVDSFDEVLSKKDYETEISALDWDDDWWNDGDYYDANIGLYHWSDYTEETLKEIMNFCFRQGLIIDDEEMDENNTILKNGKVYFKDQELVDLIDDYDLDELKTELNNAVCEAQNNADRDYTYNEIKNAFVKKIGSFERKMVEKTVYNKEKKIKEIKNVEKIYIRLNFNIKDIEAFLRDEYAKYDFIDETYGSLKTVLQGMEFFDVKFPDYDYIGNGSIDDDYLNEMTRERLKWN